MSSSRTALVKLVVAVILDVADFFIGRIIGFGSLFDVFLTVAGVAMFGWKGLAQLWEVAEVTDQIDGFVPTLTLLALAEWRAAKAREAERFEPANVPQPGAQ